MCKGCCKLSPIYILIFLTLINFIIYTDRGVLAAVASQLESPSEGLNLSSTQIGAIGSFFMLGYMIAGPIFAHYSQSTHPLVLIGIGLTIWGLSTAATGFSRSFWSISLSRSITGVGEASFVCLAPPYILDHAPEARKTTWIAVFFSALSIGQALGYVYGNIASESLGGWYWPFYLEGFCIIPFILICVFAKKDSIRVEQEGEQEEHYKISDQVKILGKNIVFIFIVLGFAAFIFSMGGLSFWGPYVIEKLYNQTPRKANMDLGIIVLTSGILGTLIGSFFYDCIINKYVKLEASERITKEKLTFIKTEKANFFLLITTFFSCIFGFLALLFDVFLYFEILIWFFLFLMNKGPIAISIMSCVPSKLRGQANATAIFFMHLFGDFPSPFVIGYFISVDVYWGVMATIIWLFWALFFWLLAWNASRFHGESNAYILKNFCKSTSYNDFNNLMRSNSDKI